MGDRDSASRRARLDLERRVEERTAELAAAVARLEREVAERRFTEEALGGSEERFRGLAECASDGIVSIDEEGRIQFVNAAMGRMFGYESGELLGQELTMLIPDRLRSRHREGLRRYLETGKRTIAWQAVPFPGLHKSGRMIPLEISFSETVLGSGRLFTGIVRDMSARRKAEEQQRKLAQHMQEMQKLESLGVLAGGVAHDFNNLLTVILGYSRLVSEELPPDSPMLARIQRIRSASEHASGIVDQLLTYSGKRPVEPKPLDLSRLVEEMLDLLRASVSGTCTLETDLARDLPAVEGDPTRVRQVILNLVSNASEALAGARGSVGLRTGVVDADRAHLAHAFGLPDPPAAPYVVLEVADTGKGMSADEQARVFEPFHSTKSRGRGLGLATVLGIVRAHGGVIKVESERGRGSTFRVLLPASSRVATSWADERAAAESRGHGALVLVVDDEEYVLELTQAFLRRYGFNVLAALGGRKGVEAFDAHRDEIAAVVLDLAMPDLDGVESLLAMREIRPDVPVVVVSGYGEEIVARRFSAHGPVQLLGKPYDPEDLVEKILRAVGSSRPRE
jgi:two-component system cell cycle sensor histidine kinase/response regulator CckA